MNTPLRLALVLVIITLACTLALLVRDGTDLDASFGHRAALRNPPSVDRLPERPDRDAAERAPATPERGSAPDRVSTAPRSSIEPSGTVRYTAGLHHEPMAVTAGVPSSAPQELHVSPADTRVSVSPSADRWHGFGSEIQLASATAPMAPPVAETNTIKELYVRDKDIAIVLEMLSREGKRNIVASRNVKGPITITLYNTTVDDAIAAIVKMQGLVARQEGDYMRVYTPEDLEEAEVQAAGMDVRIYKPRHISAIDLVNILTPHLSQRGKISNTKPNQSGIAANADNAGGDNLAVDDAIVIQDVESVLQRVEEIIARVDIRPVQVLIEATVLRVELNDSNQMGVNFALFSGHTLSLFGQGTLIDNAAGFDPAFLVDGVGRMRDGFVDSTHGFKFGIVRGDLTAFVKLLETVGHTTLVASPKVLAMNKQRAEIIVGAQLGYRTVTTTETAAVENIQFLEVGTQLKLRPFVQPDGMIRLELHPEKSSGRVSETTGLPEKATTQVTTNLAVPSGTTVVIGGLIEEEQQKSVQQVPFLGSLRWVGPLFRDETTTTRRQEIIVLITPRIVDESAWDCEAQRELDLFEARRDSLERSFPHYTRIALARKYFEKALRYRDAGDIATACKLVNVALHFDPTDEAAIRLRDALAAHTQGSFHAAELAPELGEPHGSTNRVKSQPSARKDRRDRTIR